MKINRWQLNKKKLQTTPKDERALFILLGHAVNEINILNKTFYLSTMFENESEWVVQIHVSQNLVYARTLIGKLYEAWQLLKKGYFQTKLSEKYDAQLETTVVDALKQLKKYFGPKNLIADIRNGFSFHCSSRFDHKHKPPVL